jgi:hypothetical protein
MKRIINVFYDNIDKKWKAQDFKKHNLLSAFTKEELESKLSMFLCEKKDNIWYLPQDIKIK